MQQRLDKVKEADAANRPPEWLNQVNSKGLSFNFYGESKYNMTKGSSGNYFDPHRFVLIPGFKLSDNAYFNSELELEHGGVDDTDGGRFDGELELEQFYADVKINDWLNWRSLGVSLIPIGSINLRHEPDQFYSVHRPIMYKKVIPSTWMEGSMGFFGDVPQMEGLSWFFLVSQGLSSADNKITDSDGIRKTRPNLRAKGDNRQLAYTMRLEYDGASSETEWLKGFSGSTSTYIGNYQETTTTDTDLYLWDVEAKYRWSSGLLNNFEVIGDYAHLHFASPDAIADANVGDVMFGYRLELAYHHQMEGDQKLIPFFRLEGYDTSEGSKDSNVFAGDTGRSHYLTYGTYFQLNRHMELKAAVRQSIDDADNTEFSIGIGYQF